MSESSNQSPVKYEAQEEEESEEEKFEDESPEKMDTELFRKTNEEALQKSINLD